MNLYTFFKVILRYWWLITLTVLATTSGAAYGVSLIEPVYQGTARVVLKPSPLLTDPNLQINAQNALERRTLINTLAFIAQTSGMYEQAAKVLNTTPGVVYAAELTAIVIPDANLIEIHARSTDAALAADITNVVAAELSKQVPQQTFQMEIIDRAMVPSIPVEPQPTRTISLAVVFGLVVGVGLSMLAFLAPSILVTRSVSSSDEYRITSTPDEIPGGPEPDATVKTQPSYTR